MKYTAATLALLTGLSAAQENPFGDVVPRCAVDCLVTGVQSVGCDVRDPACACAPENQAALASQEFIDCLTEACSANEIGAAIAGGGAICDALLPSETTEGSPTETESAESEPTSSSDAGSSTSAATSAEAEPTGDEAEEDEGSNGDDEGSDADGDEGSDDEGEAGSGDEGAAAAAPAIFGGAAVVAALLAL